MMTPSELLTRAADLVRDTAAAASQGAWKATDLAPHGHRAWWVEQGGPEEFGCVADLWSANASSDAHWIALASPAVAPWIEGMLRDAAERVLWATSWEQVTDIPERCLAEHVVSVLGVKEDGTDG